MKKEILIALICSLLFFSSLYGQMSISGRKYHIIEEKGTAFLSEISSLEAVELNSSTKTGNRQQILWHKVYQFTQTKSLAIGFNNTLFFGGADFPPVEAALYPLFSDTNPPEPLWTYSGAEYSVWYVAATESADLLAGINYLSPNMDSEGDGYCYLYLWHTGSSEPIGIYDFSGYLPASVEPVVILEETQEVFIVMRNTNEDTATIYVIEPYSEEPPEAIVLAKSFAQILRVSSDGMIFGLLQGPELAIYDRELGSLRQMVRVGASTHNFSMSSCGTFIVSGWRDAIIHEWDGIRYRERFRHRDTDRVWYHAHCMISGDGSTAVLSAYTDDYDLNRIYLINLLNYEIVWSYEIPRAEESSLQLLPAQSSISHDGSVFVLGNWGDQSVTNPALMVFRREIAEPYLLLSPTGSIVRTAITDYSPYYAAAGGKLVHMNNWGSGTNLYAIDLEIDHDYGELSGTLTDKENNQPLSEVSVSLGEWKREYSNEQGLYGFSKLIPGTYTLIMEKTGYYTYILEELEILPGSNSVHNVEMIPLPTVSLQGRVLKGDKPTEGLQGASVSLSGYSEYESHTNEDGLFLIKEVFVNQNYTLTIDHPLYNKSSKTLTTGSEDLVIDDIILSITPFPVDNVLAIPTDNNKVLLNWSDPVQALLRRFSYDNGTVEAAVGFNSGTANSVLGSLHHHHAKLLGISWHLSGAIVHDEVDLFVFGLNEDGFPDPTELIFRTERVSSIQHEWNHYEFSDPVTAQHGFLIGISASAGGHLGLSIDDGQEMGFLKQYYVFDYSIGMDFQVYSTGNYLLQAWGYDYGYLCYPDFDYAVLRDGTEPSNNLLKNGECHPISENVSLHRYRTGNISHKLYHPIPRNYGYQTITQSVPALQGYDIYRLAASESFNNKEWQFLGSTSENQFLDDAWLDIVDGDYRYAVVARYTAEDESQPALSNVLEKNLNTNLTLNITTNSQDSAYNAFLEVFQSDTENGLYFSAKADENGIAYIPDILKGVYDIVVSLNAFETYRQTEAALLDDETTLNVELIEKLLPVRNLKYERVEENGYSYALLTWSPPDPDNNDKQRKNDRNRALLGYQIMRNEELIVTDHPDTLFIDYPVWSGRYFYGVRAVYDSGLSETVNTEELELIRPDPQNKLLTNYPNPFNLKTTILFSLADEQRVVLEIYNLRGEFVATVLDDKMGAGEQSTTWDGKNRNGKTVASGIYFCLMKSGGYRSVRKMLFLK